MTEDCFLSRVKALSAVANRFSVVDWIRCAACISVALRSAVIAADWRTFLLEDWMAATIKDGWHWST